MVVTGTIAFDTDGHADIINITGVLTPQPQLQPCPRSVALPAAVACQSD